MTQFFRRLTIIFSAGAFGGLVNSITLWALGELKVTAALGVKLAPNLTSAWLYPRIVWGGLWGILFLIPLFRGSFIKRGFLLSLGPTLIQLFIVFPQKAHKGIMGLDLGTMTPVIVVVLNAVWGIAAALWLRGIGEE
ncbi:hypothetical protein EP232_03425 [bacterium]|nr:MAG: hypothetical protein EP232_03425 [bacterium]